MGRAIIIDESIARALNGASVTITIPSSGEHLGRNGYARIEGLRLWYRWDETVYLDTINSRGDITAGGLHHVPVKDLLLLLEHLKAEVGRNRPSPDQNQPSSEPTDALLELCQARSLCCEDLDEAVHDAADQAAASGLNRVAESSQQEGILSNSTSRASRINNSGLRAQVEFLVSVHGAEQARNILLEIEKT